MLILTLVMWSLGLLPKSFMLSSLYFKYQMTLCVHHAKTTQTCRNDSEKWKRSTCTQQTPVRIMSWQHLYIRPSTNAHFPWQSPLMLSILAPQNLHIATPVSVSCYCTWTPGLLDTLSVWEGLGGTSLGLFHLSPLNRFLPKTLDNLNNNPRKYPPN